MAEVLGVVSAVAALGAAISQLHEAQNSCQEILASVANRRDPLSKDIQRNVELWMTSFRHVQSLLTDSNLPEHELQFFIHNMEEINSGLRDLRKIIAKLSLTNQGRVKFMFLGNEIGSVMNRIDRQFSLVQRFQQTASDLQPFRQRALVELVATIPRPPTGAPTGTTQPQAVVTGLQDEIYIDEIGEQAFRFPDEMVFENGENFVLALKDTSQLAASADILFEQKDGHAGLQQWLLGLREAQNTTKEGVRRGYSEGSGAVTMKDEAVLLDVLKTLKVPLASVYRLLDGQSAIDRHMYAVSSCWTFSSSTQNGLLLEAASQLQIVYNLVAQRDNKNNYEMAMISLEIARTTKEDIFAMFTLAVMSILFLPGALIATLFSMDLFDWSAKDGKKF
ncbi:hypothetical protein CEP54_013312 [Fusarium duplospermum]|uniref:Uncharacterized protein n=1 Tax=Fusarium duplospermum TaxID=1325734 RepID=A0A428P3Q6_9HYPO|nr:hypothetical protein CEP54_013312 [Fusarium duplospermum]